MPREIAVKMRVFATGRKPLQPAAQARKSLPRLAIPASRRAQTSPCAPETRAHGHLLQCDPTKTTGAEREVNWFEHCPRSSNKRGYERNTLSSRGPFYDDRELFLGRAESPNLRRHADQEAHHGQFEQIALVDAQRREQCPADTQMQQSTTKQRNPAQIISNLAKYVQPT